MKKYLFMAVAALATLTACQPGDEPQAIVQTREICFAPAAQTRAAATAVGNEKALQDNGFAVYGFQGADAIFANTKVVYNSDAIASLGLTSGTHYDVNLWAPAVAADVRYWANASYKFSGAYPATGNGYVMDKDGKQTITNFVNNGTVDLLVSNVVLVDNTADTKSAVALNFEHMLSRVKFTFKNGFDGNEVIEIKDVVIYDAGKTASATIAGGDTKPVPTWTITDKANIDFGDMDSESENARFGKNAKDTTCYKYIIPGEESYTMGFTLIVYSEGVQVATKTYSVDNNNAITVKPNAAFAPGQGYNFTATINANKAGDIYPIQFSVDVEPWKEDQNYDLELN